MLRSSAFRLALAGTIATAFCACAQDDRVNFPLTVHQELEFHTPGWPVAVAWAPDGSKIAVASNYGNTLTVWDRSGRQLSTIDVGGGPYLNGSLEFANGATQLLFLPPAGASDNVALSIRDASTGAIAKSVQGPNPGKDHDLNQATYFTLSPNRQLLAAANFDAPPSDTDIVFYDTRDWKILKAYPITGGVFSIAFFGHGSELAVGFINGTVSVFDANLQKPPTKVPGLVPVAGGPTINAVAGSPDGDFIFVGEEFPHDPDRDRGLARVIRVRDGATVASIDLGASNTVWHAEWDPKNRYVAFVDHNQNLYVWRPHAAEPSYEKITLSSRGLSLAVSPDGNRIAATLESGVVIYAIS